MLNFKKRLICLMLCLVMIVSLGFTAFADDPSGETSEETQKQTEEEQHGTGIGGLTPTQPSTSSSSSSSSTPASSTVLLKWQVIFEPGKGTGKHYSIRVQYKESEGGTYIAYPDCDFEAPEGYEFDYWKDENDGSVYRYSDGKIPVFDDMTLVAIYKESEQIKVTYDPGEGNGSAQSFHYDKNSSITIKKSKTDLGFTPKTGYVFSHWDVGGKVYSSGSTLNLGENDVTITAKWTEYVESVSSESSEPEPIEEEPVEEIEEEKPFEPQTLSFNISGDVPVSGIEYYLEEDIGGTPSLRPTVLSTSSIVDNTTANFINSGDALAAFDLALLSDGNAYNGNAKGSLTYRLNGTQANKPSNYSEHVLALVHVMENSKFTGNAYYVAEGKKAFLYSKETGEKVEAAGISFKEENGVYRPVISDVDTFGTFAYQSSDGYITEVKLCPDQNASYIAMSTDSLSPFLLCWLEIGHAKEAFTLPLWAWIVIAAVIVIIGGLVAVYLIGRNSQEKARRERREKLNRNNLSGNGGTGSSGITGFDD